MTPEEEQRLRNAAQFAAWSLWLLHKQLDPDCKTVTVRLELDGFSPNCVTMYEPRDKK